MEEDLNMTLLATRACLSLWFWNRETGREEGDGNSLLLNYRTINNLVNGVIFVTFPAGTSPPNAPQHLSPFFCRDTSSLVLAGSRLS
jgi:hypothetical protein